MFDVNNVNEEYTVVSKGIHVNLKIIYLRKTHDVCYAMQQLIQSLLSEALMVSVLIVQSLKIIFPDEKNKNLFSMNLTVRLHGGKCTQCNNKCSNF